MAVFAPNNTVRLFLEYTSRGIAHTMMFRQPEVSTEAQGLTMLATIITPLRSLMLTTDSFTGVRRSTKGSDFSFPINFTPVAGLSPVVSTEVDPESFEFSWVGRDGTFGSRATWYFYGTRGGQARATDNRYEYGEFEEVDAVRDAIAAAASISTTGLRVVTASQGQPVVATYTNCRNNAYWQTAQR